MYTVNALLQAYSASMPSRGGVDFHVTGLRQCVTHVWRTQWWLGLYAGFAPAAVRVRDCRIFLHLP